MVRELIVLRLHKANRFLGSVVSGVGETMGSDTHVTVAVGGVEVE